MARARSSRKWLLLLGVGLITLLIWNRYLAWREASQDGVILAASARYGMPASLVKAVVWKESRFDPSVRGSKGEVGLMQLMPGTAEEWAKAERFPMASADVLFDPGLNTRAGTWYLRKLYQRYLHTDNPIPYTLADYNAGRNNVLRWAKGEAATNSLRFVEAIGYPTTRAYVKAITGRMGRYSDLVGR